MVLLFCCSESISQTLGVSTLLLEGTCLVCWIDCFRSVGGSWLKSHLVLIWRLVGVESSLGSWIGIHKYGDWFLGMNCVGWRVAPLVRSVVVWLYFLVLFSFVLQVILNVLISGIFQTVRMILLLVEVLPVNFRIPRRGFRSYFARVIVIDHWSCHRNLCNLWSLILDPLRHLIELLNTVLGEPMTLSCRPLRFLGWLLLFVVVDQLDFLLSLLDQLPIPLFPKHFELLAICLLLLQGLQLFLLLLKFPVFLNEFCFGLCGVTLRRVAQRNIRALPKRLLVGYRYEARHFWSRWRSEPTLLWKDCWMWGQRVLFLLTKILVESLVIVKKAVSII